LALLPVLATLACAGARPALPPGNPEALGLSRAGLAAITPALQSYVDSGKLAGIYAVIVRDGRIGYERTFGWSDVEHRKPMRRNTVFRIFSMTKPVVAAGAMKLIDQGKLSLDDPVSKYIPAFAGLKVYAGGAADAPLVSDADSVMTIRHLLTHTSGLGYGLTREPADSIFVRAHLYDPASTLEQFVDSVAKLPLMFSPGTRWSYSSALEVVGRVIEVISGQTLDRYLEEQLFQPLGMHETAFRHRADLDARTAVLYDRDAQGRLRVVIGGLMGMYEPQARFLWASGGLLSTPDDFMRFAQMLLNGGELNGVRVLSPQSVAEVTRNQLTPEHMEQARATMVENGYGFGLAGAVLVDSAQSTAGGAAGIYRWSGYVGTYFWIDPRNRLLAMVWTQFSPGRAYPLERDFQRLVYLALQPRPE
jgi:CubicO group peptidase (beta-lactamase class C family)